MYNEVLRDEEYIHRLKTAIYEQYGIAISEIVPAERGYYGETWKLYAETGCYFLKMDYLDFHQKRFQRGLSVIEYLCENGIDFVGKVIKPGKTGSILGLTRRCWDCLNGWTAKMWRRMKPKGWSTVCCAKYIR